MSENNCSYRIAYEKQKKRAERAEQDARFAAEALLLHNKDALPMATRMVEMEQALEAALLRAERAEAERDAAQSTITDLQATVERMREALAEAIESVEDWAGYASEYFRQKHGLKEELARFRATFGDAS